MPNRTADYAELVRCIVHDDWADYDRRTQKLNEESGWDGWSEFLTSAFLVAVERRFDEATDPAEVIRFVAEARAEFTASGSDFDPAGAEAMINSVLGRASAAGVDTQTVVQVEIVLIRKLLRDSNLTDAELHAFLAEAEQISAEWSMEGEAGQP
jgi:hypothetical protein